MENNLSNFNVSFHLFFPVPPDIGDWQADSDRLVPSQELGSLSQSQSQQAVGLVTAEHPEAQRSEVTDLKIPCNLAAGLVSNSGMEIPVQGSFYSSGTPLDLR